MRKAGGFFRKNDHEMTPDPKCWHCGYSLTGMTVDDLCPECGTPVWSQKPPDHAFNLAQRAQLWGVLSFALFFACIGPFAIIPAIFALRYASRAERESRFGLAGGQVPGGLRVGQIFAWITVALSSLSIILYIAIFGVGMLSFWV